MKDDMLAYVIASLLLAVALLAISLRKTYFYLPEAELKRQAAHGDPVAKALYRAAAYGQSLALLLWIITGISAAVSFVLFARLAPFFFGLVVVAVSLWLVFAWVPSRNLSSFAARLALYATPVLAGLLNYLHTPLSRILDYLHGRFPVTVHTGLYDREDLLLLIQQQRHQADSRISAYELDLLERVMRFGDSIVRDILVPRKTVKVVAAEEAIGPILLGELHNSGFTRFPVYRKTKSTLIGCLHLQDITNVRRGGLVENYMHEPLTYVHESDPLAEVLQVFYRTKEHLFVVINSFEEYVGIITIEDVLHKLLGELPKSQPSDNENLQAVAARHTHLKNPEPSEPQPVVHADAEHEVTEIEAKPRQTPEKVVE